MPHRPYTSSVMEPTPPKQRFRKFSKNLVRELDSPAEERHPEDFAGEENGFEKAHTKVMERLVQCLAQNNYQSLFWRFNKTRDGYLTSGEFCEGMRSIAFSHASDPVLARVFRKIGPNARTRDCLTYKELKGYINRFTGQHKERQWHQKSKTSRHGDPWFASHPPPPNRRDAGSDIILPGCYYTPRPPNRANILATGMGTTLRGSTLHAI